jgi:peptidoglycan/xylan/chitin deacetylase (PgdA/CDA1 family)
MSFRSCAYLTFDDSSSARMDDLVSYLAGKGIPALFYCRGDRLAENRDAAVRAVRKGFTLANHTYSHQRSGEKDFEWIVADIERCEAMLQNIYKDAGILPPKKYFRFPHIDRGTGAWIVDYDTFTPEDRTALLAAFTDGLNVQMGPRPDAAAFAKKQKLQDWLAANGYTQPFKDVTAPWFAGGEISRAADCLYTYSNCDWMLTARHVGKWPYKTLDDLKQRARTDRYLAQEDSVNVVLAHDQGEIVDVTIALVDDMVENGLNILEV